MKVNRNYQVRRQLTSIAVVHTGSYRHRPGRVPGNEGQGGVNMKYRRYMK
jgi:hypothetical protein